MHIFLGAFNAHAKGIPVGILQHQRRSKKLEGCPYQLIKKYKDVRSFRHSKNVL